jgi:hypothetical protein
MFSTKDNEAGSIVIILCLPSKVDELVVTLTSISISVLKLIGSKG